jgi:hypothetical protein
LGNIESFAQLTIMTTNQQRKLLNNSAATFIGILVLSTCLFFTAPVTAHAQVGSLACATALFGSATSAVTLLSSVPVHDTQVISNTTAMKNVQCTWNGIAWQLARTVLHALTGSVVNWINSGFQGSPAFLTNPEGYFTNLGDQLTGEFISDTGVLSGLCSPFSVDVRLALALGQAGQTNPYTCTLSSIINNVQNSNINGFMNGDFSQGGWPAFIALSEPQNNEAGAYLQAHSDLLQRIGVKQGMVQQDLLQGNGFLSWPKCTDINNGGAIGTSYGLNDARANQLMDTGSVSWGSGYLRSNPNGNGFQQCTTETPGSIINSSLTKSLGASVDELNLTDNINEVVSALFSQLLTKTLQGGLFSASQSSSDSSNLGSLTDQLINDQQGQANSSVLQGQVADQVQSSGSAAQQAMDYRNQIVSALAAEQSLYQATNDCIANELDAATVPSSTASSTQLTPSYLQDQLSSISAAIDSINQQISDAQTNLDTASNSVSTYQDAADQIRNASSLSEANDLSNQFSSQLSTISYNGAADPTVAQSDLSSVTAGIAALETARGPYQTVCSGQQP